MNRKILIIVAVSFSTLILIATIKYFVSKNFLIPEQRVKTVALTSKPTQKLVPPTFIQEDSFTISQTQTSATHYQQGVASFENATKGILYYFSRIMIDNSEMHSHLQSEQLLELFVAALSQLEVPKSHFYLDIAKVECETHKFLYSSHSYPLQFDSEESTSQEDEEFYHGIRNAEEQFGLEKNAECNQIEDMFKNNKQQISATFNDIYGYSSMEEFQSALSDSNNLIDEIERITSIKLQPDYKIFIQNANNLSSKDLKVKQKAAHMIADYSLFEPHNYLYGNACNSSKDCTELLGRDKFEEYAENGAFLGTNGTIDLYLSLIDEKGNKTAKTGWNIYYKKLNRLGCNLSTNIDTLDRLLNKKIQESLSKMTATEKNQALTFSKELEEKYIQKARELIRC